MNAGLKIIVILVACTFVGCSSPKTDLRDGSSVAKAVILRQIKDKDIRTVEWAWVHEHIQGARESNKDSILILKDEYKWGTTFFVSAGRTYSPLRVELADGAEQIVYFDLTGYIRTN